MCPLTVSPVPTKTEKGTVFLEIAQNGTGVRVQRTELGRQSLNRFWTVWLRQLILDSTDQQHGFAVELRGLSIVVTSGVSFVGLVETVRSLASQVVPVASPPMKRRLDYSSREISWEVDHGVDLTASLKSLQLPKGARTEGGNWFASVKKTQKCKFRIGELALMVEHHVATNPPPANEPV